MSYQRLTAITGGIGAGKSIVSEILRKIGYPVFDCDAEAKRLMDNSAEIKSALIEKISPLAVLDNGEIDRKLISSVVFNDPARLEALNNIVHTAVLNEIEEWKNSHAENCQLFVETAILYQSHLDRLVDEVWEVIAPEELRIIRVTNRNNCPREEVISRIKSQTFLPEKPHSNIRVIINDDFTPVLPQILALL